MGVAPPIPTGGVVTEARGTQSLCETVRNLIMMQEIEHRVVDSASLTFSKNFTQSWLNLS